MTVPMSMAKCEKCGASIDLTADPAGTLAPCQNCGGSSWIVQLPAAEGQPSNYMLDNFVAHKLSGLTACGVKEITINKNWLGTFILTNVFRARLPNRERAYVFNFLRRAEGSLFAYGQARIALIEYLNTPRNVLSPYFRALLNFEVCIAQCYQGYELLARASGDKFYEPGGKSSAERLQMLYVDSKHMDRMIDGGKIPTEATAAIWITNDGLQSKRATLLFEELCEMLLHMGLLADQLSTLDPSINSDNSKAVRHEDSSAR
jgi:hypothetical protein